MRLLFLCILSWLSLPLFAQSCDTLLLFRKGTVLEYKNYSTTGNPFSKRDFFEITRLQYVVRDVKDSLNIRYSYVTKIGANPANEELKYEKKYVLTCDGSHVNIPLDFYGVETIYFSNVYPGIKDKGIYSSSVYNGKCTFNFPLVPGKNRFETTCNQVSMDVKTRDYKTNMSWQSSSNGMQSSLPSTTGRIVENTFSTDMSIEKSETLGQENLKTPAGTFECSKIMLTSHYAMFNRNVNSMQNMFYHPGMGLVKSEAQQSKRIINYTELVKVSKAGE